MSEHPPVPRGDDDVSLPTGPADTPTWWSTGSRGHERDDAVAWGVPSGQEPRWPAVVAIVAAIGLQVVLPVRVIQGLGPRWLIPVLEGVLLLALLIANPHRLDRESRALRLLSLVLIAVITAANMVALGELIRALLEHTTTGGRALVFASVPIWLTNVIVFGLWYWELDRGGVTARLQPVHRRPDFLFPQMSVPGSAPGWTPQFLDYLYTSFTNATAFSPTDTMPLTPWAKLLMMVQSLASLLTVALVISRAVNILN
jgi:uncharacterized membrane protein